MSLIKLSFIFGENCHKIELKSWKRAKLWLHHKYKSKWSIYKIFYLKLPNKNFSKCQDTLASYNLINFVHSPYKFNQIINIKEEEGEEDDIAHKRWIK